MKGNTPLKIEEPLIHYVPNKNDLLIEPVINLICNKTICKASTISLSLCE